MTRTYVTQWFKESFPVLESQIFRSSYRQTRTTPSSFPNYLPLSFPHLLGRTTQLNQTFQYFEGQCNHSAHEMARIAVLLFITFQAWQAQLSTWATATSILCCTGRKSNVRTSQCSQTKSPYTLLTATGSGADRKDETSGTSFNFQLSSHTLPEAVKKPSVCQSLSQDSEKRKEFFFASPYYLLSKWNKL